MPSNDTMQIACKVNGFTVADGNTWWYRIASGPWNNSYYGSADQRRDLREPQRHSIRGP